MSDTKKDDKAAVAATDAQAAEAEAARDTVPNPVGLALMVKDGIELLVHETCVAAHQAVGWVRG